MDSGYFSKKAFSLLALYLFILKNFGTAQESTSYNDDTKNPKIQHHIPTFTSKSLFSSPFSKTSFYDDLSILKDYLDKFVEIQQTYDDFIGHALTQQTIFNEVKDLLNHVSLNLVDRSALIKLRNGMEDLENLLNHSNEMLTDNNQRFKFLKIIFMLRHFKLDINKQIDISAEINSLELLINDCVNEIMAHHYDSAEKKLQKINEHHKIQFVVKRTYKLREENFYTLLNFTHSLKNNPEDILAMYQALYNEMNDVGHQSLSKLLLIICHLRPQILESMKNGTNLGENKSLETRLESFLDILKNSTKTAAINEIADAFILNYLPKLEMNIFELDQTGFFDLNRLIEAAIDRISQKLNTKNLSCVIRSNKGLYANETTLTPLTSRLKTILSWSTKYCTLSQHVKKLAQWTINSSPVEIGMKGEKQCEKVCIMNLNYTEYLYDPDKSECSDKHTNIPCPAYTTNDQFVGKTDQLAWNLKRMGNNKIQIISYLHNSTLIVDDQKWDDERRSVSTRQINKDDDKYTWQFMSDGKFVFIKNSHYQEYLTASDKGYINNVTTTDLKSKVTMSKRLRKVFTYTSKKLTSDCDWAIVECPQNL